MINLAGASILQVSAHIIGNPLDGGSLRVSDEPLAIEDDDVQQMLRAYFLHHFKVPEFFSFTYSDEDFSQNVIFQAAHAIFNQEDSFHENTIAIANKLFAATQLPSIKAGELFVALIRGAEIAGEMVNAVGIFKSETKDKFLKLSRQFKLHGEEGINIGKLDKGCLILNTVEDAGYKVLIVDNTNRAEAQFWKQDFLNIKPWVDSYHQTNSFMQLTHQFVSEKLDDEFAVSKADKIDLLNRSMDFFKSNDSFSKADFETNVLGDAEVIESFRKYGKTLMPGDEFDAIDQFEISAQAVQKQSKVFKSVLKLDSNFHVYIHGNRNLIEKGFDEEQGKHYYKLYFENET